MILMNLYIQQQSLKATTRFRPNHFYNFDDDNEDDDNLGIDIDALISSTLPSDKNDAWTPPLHKNFGVDSAFIDSNSDIDTLVSNTLPSDENDDWELPPHENISNEDDNTENLSTDIPKVFDDLLQKKSESENIGKSAGKVILLIQMTYQTITMLHNIFRNI